MTLARELRDRPDLADRIKKELKNWDNRSIKDELDVLRRYAGIEDFNTLSAE